MDYEQLRKDMEAGTQGDWVWISDSHLENVFQENCYAGAGFLEWVEEINESLNPYAVGVSVSKEANARRIARVPQLERIALAAEGLAKEVEYLRGAAPLGDYQYPQMSIGEAVVVDALEALAAYRKATQ